MVPLSAAAGRRLLRAIVAAAGLLAAPRAGAQSSPYLPLDDVAYAYIDALQARGELRELSALERPYPVHAVRAALATARDDGARAGWLRALSSALDKHFPAAWAADTGVFAATVVPYAVGQTSARRELMRADSTSAVHPGFAGRLLLHTGRVTAVARGSGDRRLRDDPEFAGKRDRAIAGRLEDAYVGAQWRYAEVSAGRMSRRWAPLGVQGLQVGDYTYSYDHLFLRLGGERLRLSTVVARLDDRRLGPDSLAQRHFSAHRLAARIGSVELGATESIVYGGVDRAFDPALASPTNVWSIAQYAENRDVNVLYGADFAWRPRWVGLIAAQFMLDDVQIDNCGAGCQEPPSYGVTVSIEGVPLVADVRGFGSYVQVSNLAYRTINPYEQYASLNVGLGLGFSDYDEARAGIDFGSLLAAPVRAYIALRRQGSGDYRAPFPPPDELPLGPTFLGGPLVKTFRVGLSGGARLLDAVELRGDVGVNQLISAAPTATTLEGRVTVAVESARLRFVTPVR